MPRAYKGPLFHKAHYNIIAARIREQLEMNEAVKAIKPDNVNFYVGFQNAMIELSLSLAHRFAEDNPKFDPLHFLDACSPDPENYPFSELWTD